MLFAAVSCIIIVVSSLAIERMPIAGHSDRRTTVVIGGGVIGVACAHYLVEADRRVIVIDRGTIGGACSHANCGLVSPSHVLPLAEPGAVRGALASLFRRNAPFRIKPRFSPRLWKWLWKFARRCNHANMVDSARGIQPLLISSHRLYEDLIANTGLECEWQSRGLLFVFRSQKAMDHYSEFNDLLAVEFNEPAQRLEGEALINKEPALRDDLAGAWFYPGDSHLRPDRLMSSWRACLAARGVEFREHCEFLGLLGGDRASGVQTSTGEIAGDEFVFATGAWTPLFEKHLGLRIPIQPGKGYSMTMPVPEQSPRLPMLLPEHRVAVTPMDTGFRLGSIMEFAGYDTSLKPKRLRLLTRGAAHYLRFPPPEKVEERWYGWRPMTWDSRPIIDFVPQHDNIVVAAGHNMLGLSMAPATGKLVAELLTKSPAHIDAGPYSARRF